MEKVAIKCPKCKVGLEVVNTRDEAVKSIKCPNCQAQIKVIFREPQVEPSTPKPNDGITHLPDKKAGSTPPPATDGATQLPGDYFKDDQTVVQGHPGRLVCNGKEYPLKMGENIVGRKNHTKPTTLMLDVNDSYMSRMHIRINVQKVGTGLQATVSNYQNTNATQVAGLPLAKGEMVVLNNGMTITMGETTVTYRS